MAFGIPVIINMKEGKIGRKKINERKQRHILPSVALRELALPLNHWARSRRPKTLRIPPSSPPISPDSSRLASIRSGKPSPIIGFYSFAVVSIPIGGDGVWGSAHHVWGFWEGERVWICSQGIILWVLFNA